MRFINYTGLSNEKDNESVFFINSVLTEEFMLFHKTLNYHWNIEGENFLSLHKLLGSHYDWLKESIDKLAERIRILGQVTPLNLKQIDETSQLSEGDPWCAQSEMIYDLVSSHAKVIKIIRQAISGLSSSNDFSTIDLLVNLLSRHEKEAWILSSHLKQE